MEDFNKALSELAGTVWLVILASWGGVVNYLGSINGTKKFKFFELLVAISTSGFAGLITFYACAANDVSYAYTAVLSGVAGHMGARAIAALEKRYFGKDFSNGN